MHGLLGPAFFDVERAEHFLGGHLHHELNTPSQTLRTTLPTKPSVTITSQHAAVDVPALDVADELLLERAVLKEACVSLASSWPFGFLGADVHQADGRLSRLQDMTGEDAAHDAVLEQVFRLRADVGSDVDQDARAAQGRHDGGDARPLHVLQKATQAKPARHHGPGVAGADDAHRPCVRPGAASSG